MVLLAVSLNLSHVRISNESSVILTWYIGNKSREKWCSSKGERDRLLAHTC